MQKDLELCSAGLSRHHVVADADIAAKTPFADITLTGGVLAEESLKLFK